MKQILKYIFKHKSLLIIPTIAMIASISVDLAEPYLSKVLIDDVIVGGNTNIFLKILLGLLAICLLRSCFGYIKEYFSDKLGAEVSRELKKDLFQHIQGLSFSYFDNMNTGELMSRIGEDADNVWDTIGFGFRLLLENIIYFVITTIILLHFDWRLTLICLACMPLIALINIRLEKDIDKTYEELSDQNAIINTAAQENIAGVRLVKAFAREKYEILKFLNLNEKRYEISMKQAKILGKNMPLADFLTNVSVVLMITFGGIFVMKGSLTIGTLFAFSQYIWRLTNPMRMLGWLMNLIAQNNASAKKIEKIMSVEKEIKDKEDCITPPYMKGDVEFENVSFKYNDNYILKDINLKAKKGSTIAIMGGIGSGKSSLASLIPRFYDVCDGSISIDGVDIKDLNLNYMRSKIAVVAQDSFLFSDTIENNIRYGKQNASFDEIRSACKDSCALEFIDALEDGFNTIIGERGIGLSGGQKQRLCIARALVSDCNILILDEATSALDMDTEFELLKNLYSKERASVTTFIIAHRISAVKNADEIIFLENGEIVERGTHNELLELKGRYFDIYNQQFKDFMESVESEVC